MEDRFCGRAVKSHLFKGRRSEGVGLRRHGFEMFCASRVSVRDYLILFAREGVRCGLLDCSGDKCSS